MFLQIQQQGQQQASQQISQFQQGKINNNRDTRIPQLGFAQLQQIPQIQQPPVANFGGNQHKNFEEYTDYVSQYSDQGSKYEKQKLPNHPNFSSNKQSHNKMFTEILQPSTERERLNNDQLFLAVTLIQPDLVEKILKFDKVSPSIKDNEKNTPLHICFQNFSKDIFLSGKIAKLLLDYGANPNCRNKEGWCPIHLAAKKGSLSAVKFAVAHNLSKLQSTENQKNKKQDMKIQIQKKQLDDDEDGLDGREQKNLQLFNLKKKGGSEKWSLLHIAANLGHVSMLEFLYQINYDMTTQNVLGQQARQVAIHSLILHKLLKKFENLWMNVAIFSDDEMAQGIGYLNYGGVIDQVSNTPLSAFQEYQQQQLWSKNREMINEKRNVQDLKHLIEQTMQKKKSFLNSSDFSSLMEIENNQTQGNILQRKLSGLTITNNNINIDSRNNSFVNTTNKNSFLDNPQQNNYYSANNNYSSNSMINKNNQLNSANNSFISSTSNNQNGQNNQDYYKSNQMNSHNTSKNDNLNNTSQNGLHKKLINNSQFQNRNEKEDDFALDIEPENTEEDLEGTIYQREGTFKVDSNNRIDGGKQAIEDKRFSLLNYKDTELNDNEFEECTYEEQKAKENKFVGQFAEEQNSSSNQMVSHQKKRADWNIFNQRKQKEMQIAQQLTLDKFINEILHIQTLITTLSSSCQLQMNNLNTISFQYTQTNPNQSIPFSIQKQIHANTSTQSMTKSPSYNQLFCSNQTNQSNYQTRQNRSNSKIFDSQWLTPLPSHRQRNTSQNTRQNNLYDTSEILSNESNDQHNYLINNYSKLPETLKLLNYLHLIHLKLVKMDQIHFQSEVLPMNIYILSEFLCFDKNNTNQQDTLKKQAQIIPNILLELFDHFINVLRNSCYYYGEENSISSQSSPRGRTLNFTDVSQQATPTPSRLNYHQTGIKQGGRGNSNLTPQSSPFPRTAHSPHQSKSPFTNKNRTANTPLNTNKTTHFNNQNHIISRNLSKSPSSNSLSSSSQSDSLCSDNEDSVDARPMTSLELFDCLLRILRLFEILGCQEIKQKIMQSIQIKVKSPQQLYQSEEALIVKDRQRSFSPFSFISPQEENTPNNRNREKNRGASTSPFGRSNNANNYTLKEYYVKCHKEDHYSEKIIYDFESFQTCQYLQTKFAFNQLQPSHLKPQVQSVSPQPGLRQNHQNKFKFVDLPKGHRQSKSTFNSPKNKPDNNVSPVSYKNDVSHNYFPSTKLQNLSSFQIAIDQYSQKSTNNTTENARSNTNNQRPATNNQRSFTDNFNIKTRNENNQRIFTDNQRTNTDKSPTNIFKNDSSTSSFLSNQSTGANTNKMQDKNAISKNIQPKSQSFYIGGYPQDHQKNNNISSQQSKLQLQQQPNFQKKSSSNNYNDSMEISIDQINQKEQKINDLNRISDMPIPNIQKLNNTQNEKKIHQTFQSILNDQKNMINQNNYKGTTPNASFINTNNKDLSISQISMSPLLNKSNILRNVSSNSLLNQTGNQANNSFISQPHQNIFNSAGISYIEKPLNVSHNQSTNSIYSNNQIKTTPNQYIQQQQAQTLFSKKDIIERKNLFDYNSSQSQPMLNIIDTNKMASSWLNSKQGTQNTTGLNTDKAQQQSNSMLLKNQKNVPLLQLDLQNNSTIKKAHYQTSGPQMLHGSNKQLQGDISDDEMIESKRPFASNYSTTSPIPNKQNQHNQLPQQQQQQQYHSNPVQNIQRQQQPNCFSKQMNLPSNQNHNNGFNSNYNTFMKSNQQRQLQQMLSNNQVGRYTNSQVGEENVTDDEEYNDEINQNKLQNSENNKYRTAKELISPFSMKQNLEKYQIL